MSGSPGVIPGQYPSSQGIRLVYQGLRRVAQGLSLIGWNLLEAAGGGYGSKWYSFFTWNPFSLSIWPLQLLIRCICCDELLSALAGCGLPAVDLVSVLSFSARLVGCTFSARFVGLCVNLVSAFVAFHRGRRGARCYLIAVFVVISPRF